MPAGNLHKGQRKTKNKEQHICNRNKGRHKTTITKTDSVSQRSETHNGLRPRHLPNNCSDKQLQGMEHPIPYEPCSHNPSNARTWDPRVTASYSPLPGGGLIFICFSTSFCSSFSFSASSSTSHTQELITSNSSYSMVPFPRSPFTSPSSSSSSSWLLRTLEPGPGKEIGGGMRPGHLLIGLGLCLRFLQQPLWL